MKESGKRETDPGRQPQQQQQGNRRQPGEGQSGDQRQQEQSSGTRPPPGQRGPQRQNQNVGPADEE